jgi:lysyl-tRNA synthetase, class II
MPKQLDVDYIRALAHGMHRQFGEGIGIDRLTMLFTDSHSVWECYLVPATSPGSGPHPAAEGEKA